MTDDHNDDVHQRPHFQMLEEIAREIHDEFLAAGEDLDDDQIHDVVELQYVNEGIDMTAFEHYAEGVSGPKFMDRLVHQAHEQHASGDADGHVMTGDDLVGLFTAIWADGFLFGIRFTRKVEELAKVPDHV